MQTLTEQMAAKLETLKLPHESIQVFERARCNIHIVCVGRTIHYIHYRAAPASR